MKVKLTYAPEGVDPKAFEFEFERLLTPEVIAVEKLTGMTFGQWRQAVYDESMIAVHALLWVLLKRETPTLKPDQVQFAMADVVFDVDLSDAEAREVIERLRKQDTLPDDEASYLAELEARFADGAETAEDPKA